MADPLQRLTSFLSELKRRRVYRVAAAYAAVAFVLLEAVDLLAGALGLPSIVLTSLVVLTLFGFPIALVLAWAFEIRPEGVRKTEPSVAGVDRSASSPVRSGAWLLATFGLLIAGAVGWWVLGREGSGPIDVGEIRSVAVLPLENLSGDPAEQPFVSGMHEELINQLSRVGALQVTSRTSVLRYGSDSLRNVREIGAELDVDAVIEGSVLRVDDDVRITVQLIHVPTDTHLWSESFVRRVRDILALHSEVARAVAEEVNAALTPAEERTLTPTRQVDPRAVDHYVRGRLLWGRRDRDSLAVALDEFRAALEIDPGYAEAWAGIADTYGVPDGYGLAADPIGRAAEAARHSLALDPTLSQAHASLAYALTMQWQWEEAEQEFIRALELNPSYATGHQWHAELLAAENRMDEAVAAARRATERDPLSGIIAWNLTRVLYFARRYDEAMENFGRIPDPMRRSPFERLFFLDPRRDADAAWTVALGDPRLPPPMLDSLRAWREKGDGTRTVVDRSIGMFSRMADSLAAANPGADVGRRGPDLPESFRNEIRLFALAEQGRLDDAFALLDRMLASGIRYFVVDLVADPALDPLRTDPRYRDILARLGLDRYWPAPSPADDG